MGIEEELKNLPQSDKEKIKEAFYKVYNKPRPDSTALTYLKGLFSRYVEPLEEGCSKCTKMIVGFWRQRLKNWKML